MNWLYKFLAAFPNLHNWITDKDFIWWPFSFLRPHPATPMTFKHTTLMTLCFGGLAFVMFSVFAVVNNMFSFDSAVTTFVGCFGGFFGWFNVITRPMWNFRAHKLKK
jgi:hypothetical protein